MGRHLIYLLLCCHCNYKLYYIAIIYYIITCPQYYCTIVLYFLLTIIVKKYRVSLLKFLLSNIYLDERNSFEIYKKMITLYYTCPRPLSQCCAPTKQNPTPVIFNNVCILYVFLYSETRARNFLSTCLQELSFTAPYFHSL